MAKKEIDVDKLITSHKPKNFKYYYHIKDNNLKQKLIDINYDLSTLDTIQNHELTTAAINATYKLYERTIIGKSKEPTVLDNGIVVSKKMVTKVGKALQQFGIGFFEYDNTSYVAIRMYYDQFDIIEIFILT